MGSMRGSFPGFYPQVGQDASRMKEAGLFSFDTNVLLGLYRYSAKTRDLLLSLLSRLQDRIWLTHQVAFEYHRGRRKTMEDQKRAYAEVQKALGKVPAQLAKGLEQFKDRHPYIQPTQIVGDVQKGVDRARKRVENLEKRHPQRTKGDAILTRLERLFADRVGPPYVGSALTAALAQATHRMELRKPPGYRDADKEGMARYGDVILWLQLLDKAREDKSPTILVTDERKGDWWDTEGEGRTPRPELVQEVFDEAGVDFWLYDTSSFIRHAEDFLGLGREKEAEEAIEEVEEAAEADRAGKYYLDLSWLREYLEQLQESRNEEEDFFRWSAGVGSPPATAQIARGRTVSTDAYENFSKVLAQSLAEWKERQRAEEDKEG